MKDSFKELLIAEKQFGIEVLSSRATAYVMALQETFMPS
jgi:hypothetical protein